MEINQVVEKFVELYGGDESDVMIFTAPGRVNLIGEHIDYNGGFVFPAAVEMKTTIVARLRNDNKIVMRATDLDMVVEADLDKLEDYKDLWWGNYQLGVAYVMMKDGYEIKGMDMLYDDTVPHGGGLSSSAAIEVATAVCFAAVSGEKDIDYVKMAVYGQKAENEYIGVNCGIMDQFASAMGEEGHAILLNCSDLSYDYAPLNLKGKKIVIGNTKKKRSLADSKYNERRSECDKGLALLQTVLPGKKTLCDITPEEFEANKGVIGDEIIEKRVRHAVEEQARVLASVEALKNDDVELFGEYLNQSHDSLRYLYEVTGAELDAMVEEARKIKGTLGSRMTGAGFGGCTVSIVEEDAVEEFIKTVGENYTKRTGLTPEFYVSEAGAGATVVKI